jgi:hypothetical protein
LWCSSGLLRNKLKTLFECDQRLHLLRQEQVVISDYPLFETRSSIPTESGGCSTKFTQLASPSSVFENDGVNHLMFKQPEAFPLPMNLGNYPEAGLRATHINL